MTAVNELEGKRQRLLNRVRELITAEHGHNDELVIPENLHVEQKPWGKIISSVDRETGQPVPPTEGILVVVHGGIDIPVNLENSNFEELVAFDDERDIEQLAASIAKNKDVGVGMTTNAYLRGMADGRYKNVAVVWVDFSRVVGDYNRLKLEEQFPKQQYDGSSLFKGEVTEERFKTLRALIELFTRDLAALAAASETMTAVALHSFDTYGSGTNTVGAQFQTETRVGQKRPLAQLFKEFPDAERPELLTQEQVVWLQALIGHYLGLVAQHTDVHTEENAVAVDAVYKAFLMPTTRLFEEIAELALVFLELRKDLFDVRTYVEGDPREQEIGRRGERLADMLHRIFTGVRELPVEVPLASHSF